MDAPTNPAGSNTRKDMTVPNAVETSKFYEEVAGWKRMPVDMEGYEDFCMNTPGEDKTVAGICHARGENATLPAQWLIYINVPDVDLALEKCLAAGGKVVVPAKDSSGGRLAVIQDPAGAVAALYQAA